MRARNTSVVAVALLILAAIICRAAEPTVTLTWDWADTTNTTGYFYMGSACRVYSTNWPVSTNVCQITVPVGSTRYVAVTAVNAFGDQSDFSNELCIQRLKPSAPTITKYTISTK